MLTPKSKTEESAERENHPRWLFAGHSSSTPQQVAATFNNVTMTWEISEEAQLDFELFSDVDGVALVINAKTGVSKAMIEFWQYFAERQFPRLIIVNGLELSEIDFDDIVLIANRVLEQTITPFLVLHDELGEPIGLISLANLQVFDHSTNVPTEYAADSELKALVSEFQDEYLDQLEEFEETGFESGLLVPALPLVQNRGIGVREIQQYLDRIHR